MNIDDELRAKLDRLLTVLPELSNDAKQIESRMSKMEQLSEVNSMILRSFLERELPGMMTDVKGINDKLSQQIILAAQQRAELDRIEQKLNITATNHAEKLNKLETQVEESKTTLWKLTGASAASAGLISALLQFVQNAVAK